MFPEELKKLIDAALADGVITDKEREVIRKKSMSLNVDMDEIDIYIQAKILKKKKEKKDSIISFIIFLVLCVFIYALFQYSQSGKLEIPGIKNYESYQEAARAHDFEAAHKILDKMLEKYHDKEIALDRFGSRSRHRQDLKDKEELLKAYQEGVEYVFNSEMLYLCSIGDKESIDRISFLLLDIKIEGTPIPEGKTGIFEVKDKHNAYASSVSSFNLKCDNLIDLAITNKNLLLAKRIIPLFKAVPNILEWGNEPVHYSLETKEIAIHKINKAIDDGVFPGVTEHINN